jgi:hypothetical protein
MHRSWKNRLKTQVSRRFLLALADRAPAAQIDYKSALESRS